MLIWAWLNIYLGLVKESFGVGLGLVSDLFRECVYRVYLELSYMVCLLWILFRVDLGLL